MKTYQHGDLIIREISELPEGLTDKGDNIVAEGEQTGHHHVIAKAKVMVMERPDELFKNVVWLKVAEPTVITHEEHKPIKLEPAYYQVTRVQEYDYFKQMKRNVVD